MKTATFILVLLVLFASNAPQSIAQKRRGTQRPAATKPATEQPATTAATPTPTPIPKPAIPSAPVLLAVVNGENITSAILEKGTREQIEGLPGRLAEARQQVLNLEINTALLDIEAHKRKV